MKARKGQPELRGFSRKENRAVQAVPFLVLFLATLAVYAQVRHFDFVNYDDPDYVTRNIHVQRGLTLDSIVWAFTSGEAANWFPVTRLSHLLDYQLFGPASGWHHLTNVFFHALATLFLFAFLNRATRARWPSAFVALVFALHPLHVESVAWVAERKDVLSAFFWFLGLWAYVPYTERPGMGRYALVFCSLGLGLLAKPMVVTFPFVLLLLDVWPLQRPRTAALITEKIPLFVLSAASAVTTFLVQRHSGAVKAVQSFPPSLRIENALVSYVVYAGKMFWPTRLAVFYPYPEVVPAWEAVAAGVVLLAITLLVLYRGRPYLAVGWFWYLGTLVPVIGLVQVGAQARADRYMYVPMIGLLIMLAWAAPRIAGATPALPIAAVAACAACAVLAWGQLQYWKNSETLFQHALDVTSDNYIAQHNLGSYLLNQQGRLPEAIQHLQAALVLNPNSIEARTDLATALAMTPGRAEDAVAQYQAALRINPDSAIPHNNLGNALSEIPGRMADAIAEYRTALRIDPDYAEARNNLALAHYKLGAELAKMPDRQAEAIAHLDEALRIRPDYAEAHNDLGVVLASAGRTSEAIAHFEAALKINPAYADAHYNLGIALSQIPGRLTEALTHLEAAEREKPNPQLRAAILRLKNSSPTVR